MVQFRPISTAADEDKNCLRSNNARGNILSNLKRRLRLASRSKRAALAKMPKRMLAIKMCVQCSMDAKAFIGK